MKLKLLIWSLSSQILAVVLAIALFKSGLSTRVAGVIAGFGFALVAVQHLAILLKAPKPMKWVSSWMVLFFLAGGVFPIFLMQLLQSPGQSFSAQIFLGIRGFQWHATSQTLYLGLILATAIDALRVGLRRPNSSEL